MPRFVPPAGTPLRMGQVLASLRTAVSSNGHGQECLEALSQHFRVKHVLGASSGRAGLWLLLKSFHRMHPDRDVVAIPAYTCFSVAAAIARAGLKIALIDVDPQTFELDSSDLNGLPDKKLLAVIVCNLFGFPSDLDAIREVAEAKRAHVIDDAAQALGAKRNGRFAGTLGDAGLYSLGRGKSLGSIEGGVIVTDSEEIADAVRAQARNLGAAPLSHGAWLLCEMLAYSVLLRPNFYWIPNSLPFLGLGTTEFDPSFATDKIHVLSTGLLPQLIEGLEKINEVRRANARAIADALKGNANFELPTPAANSLPTFVRVPALARSKAIRDRAVAALRSAGIGASSFYPSAICDIAGIDHYMADPGLHLKNAESLSERLFTLPAHPLVTGKDIQQLAETLGTLPVEV